MEKLAIEIINSKIYTIRGERVMLDSDLAKLYEVETKYLNRQVKRNFTRFDEEDFMFQLTDIELENLRCQNGTTNIKMTRTNPYVFTEQGVYMWNSLRQSELLHFVRVETEDDIPKVSL